MQRYGDLTSDTNFQAESYPTCCDKRNHLRQSRHKGCSDDAIKGTQGVRPFVCSSLYRCYKDAAKEKNEIEKTFFPAYFFSFSKTFRIFAPSLLSKAESQ